MKFALVCLVVIVTIVGHCGPAMAGGSCCGKAKKRAAAAKLSRPSETDVEHDPYAESDGELPQVSELRADRNGRKRSKAATKKSAGSKRRASGRARASKRLSSGGAEAAESRDDPKPNVRQRSSKKNRRSSNKQN
ncbi:hypothetical protein HDE_10462 [Halotydeus destructor]|nr:hypothetical protein HDE_10462 [Halotydeus destructor]